MVEEAFRYEQLDLAKQQIRLVTINPRSPEREDVECDIHVFDVDTAPPYVTLSYMWGPPTPTKPIWLNGKRFVVRQNLYDFLCCYRNDPSNVHFIWIDQICISQAHTGERNHQVRQMSQIYSKCVYVIIWLFLDLRQVAEGFVATSDFDCAHYISQCGYFGRLWVIQEILLPCGVRVLCGGVWISWDKLNAISPPLAQDFAWLGTDLWQELLWAESPKLGIMELSTKRNRSAAALNLSECVHYFSRHQCEDPRDKVYGLLGLVKENQKPEVDYGKTVQEVFLDVLRVIPSSDWQSTSWPFILRLSLVSKNMGLRKHQYGINLLLQDLDNLHAGLRSGKKSGRDNRNPVTAMGYEAVGSASEMDHWWYEYDGEVYSRYSALHP